MNVGPSTTSAEYVPYKSAVSALPAHCGASSTAQSKNDQIWDQVQPQVTHDQQCDDALTPLILVARPTSPTREA